MVGTHPSRIDYRMQGGRLSLSLEKNKHVSLSFFDQQVSLLLYNYIKGTPTESTRYIGFKKVYLMVM